MEGVGVKMVAGETGVRVGRNVGVVNGIVGGSDVDSIGLEGEDQGWGICDTKWRSGVQSAAPYEKGKNPFSRSLGIRTKMRGTGQTQAPLL
eukprot:417195-Hanusia_phi.AAC.1